MAQRIVTAVIYALVAVGGVIGGTGMPQTVEGWIGLVITALTAFWGKFSSEQTFVAANRAAWTPEQRKVEGGK